MERKGVGRGEFQFVGGAQVTLLGSVLDRTSLKQGITTEGNFLSLNLCLGLMATKADNIILRGGGSEALWLGHLPCQ